MSVWDTFYRLAELSIDLRDSGGSNATIYGNGRNQVAVTIRVRVLASANEELNLTDNDIFKAVYLCNYTDGKPLSGKWELKQEGGDYVGAVGYSRSDDNDAQQTRLVVLTCYLSSAEQSSSALIALGLRVPGIGDFDTSQNGTSTINAPSGQPGSVFKYPKHINIHTLNEISYSNAQNIRITNLWGSVDNMVQISETLPIEIFSGSDSEGVVNKGMAYYRTATITPAIDAIFIKKEWKGNKTVNKWFKLVGRGGDNSADLVWGFNTRDSSLSAPVHVFDTSFVFIDAERFGVEYSSNGGLSLTGNSTQARITKAWFMRLSLSNKVFSEFVSTESIAVSVLHLRHRAYFYTGETWRQEGWLNSEKNEAAVTVFDRFGNTGDITIKVSTDRSSVSQLIINGVSANTYFSE